MIRLTLRVYIKNILTFILSLILLLCVSSFGLAQTNKTKNIDLGILTGVLLPQNITGLNDNFIVSGVRLAKGISEFRPEILFLQGKENGAEFTLLDLTIKNTLFTDNLGGLKPIWTIGWHYARYKRPDQGTTTFDYINAPGLHYGFGFEIPFVHNLVMRNDFSLSNGPGRLLVVSLGLQWTFDSEATEQTSTP